MLKNAAIYTVLEADPASPVKHFIKPDELDMMDFVRHTVNCERFDVIALPENILLYVDDEGLLKDPELLTRITLDIAEEPLFVAGRILLVNDLSDSLSEEELAGGVPHYAPLTPEQHGWLGKYAQFAIVGGDV